MVLDPKRASSLALVVNELITNSLKYAFPNEGEGRVEIRSHVRDGEVTVVVRDNGIGMPPEFDHERAGSLGHAHRPQPGPHRSEGSIHIADRRRHDCDDCLPHCP